MEKDPRKYKCKTAGNYPSDELTVNCPPFNSCGGIKDGLSFRFGNDGPWILSFKDLEAIYKKAKSFLI